MSTNTFKKTERLASKKLIQELFSKGSSFYLYPFKVIVLPNPNQEVATHQVLVTVPKRNHKTAVARNRVKRRIKEAYRLNKQQLNTNEKLLIAYIYTAKEPLDFHSIQNKLVSVLQRLTANHQPKKDEKI